MAFPNRPFDRFIYCPQSALCPLSSNRGETTGELELFAFGYDPSRLSFLFKPERLVASPYFLGLDPQSTLSAKSQFMVSSRNSKVGAHFCLCALPILQMMKPPQSSGSGYKPPALFLQKASEPAKNRMRVLM